MNESLKITLSNRSTSTRVILFTIRCFIVVISYLISTVISLINDLFVCIILNFVTSVRNGEVINLVMTNRGHKSFIK